MDTDVARVADLTHGRFCTGFLIGARGPLPQMVADDVGFAWPTKPGAGPLFRHAGAQPHEEHSSPLHWTPSPQPTPPAGSRTPVTPPDKPHENRCHTSPPGLSPEGRGVPRTVRVARRLSSRNYVSGPNS